MSLTYGEVRSPEEVEIDARVMERVQRGLRLLEEKHGPDWVDKIDLEKLNLRSSYRCILGQTYGDYEIGLAKLGIHDSSGDAAYEHGFFESHLHGPAAEAERPRRPLHNRYFELRRAWAHVVTPLVTRGE